ncbi:MAG: hypothetical protein LM523_06935 [Candidatus Contendobacter sp.]|nr:hypothetical protein [Candidatus Contendobacter sp.]
MVLIPVCCPHCRQSDVVKRGQTANDKQRYLCKNNACFAQIFILDYADRGRISNVNKQIIDRALNGNGICDTARVLGISSNPVISELKKGTTAGIGESCGIKMFESRSCYR